MENASPSALPPPGPKRHTPFYKYRYIFFVFVAIFSLGIPFVSINGHGLLRMSFLHRRLEFLGMTFDTNQLYVIPFMIFMFAGFVLLVTSIGGRVWCGWGCPQTMFRFVYRDVIQSFLLKLRTPKNKNKPLNLNTPYLKFKFVLGLLIYSCIAFLGTANLLWFFIAPHEFFNIVLTHPDEFPFTIFFWVFMSLFFIIDVTIIQENFCKYVCPYARIQSVFFDKETALVMYDENRGNNTDGSKGMKNFAGIRDKSGDCTECQACVKVCPTGIDIRDGLQLGCIECLECVDACYPIMARKNKQNLINWTTLSKIEGKKTRVVRPRTIFYASVVTAAFFILMFLSFTHADILLNINRTSQLYEVNVGKKKVENYYILLISNNTNEVKNIKYDIIADFPIEIGRGGDHIRLDPEDKMKKALILSTRLEQPLSDNESMKPKRITIRLVDQGAGDKIIAEKQVMFFLPKSAFK